MGRNGKEEGSIDKDGEKRYQLEVVVMDYERLLNKHVSVANALHIYFTLFIEYWQSSTRFWNEDQSCLSGPLPRLKFET